MHQISLEITQKTFHFPGTVQVFSNPTPIAQSKINPEKKKNQPTSSLVQISFGKVLSHLFSDPMNLVTHEAPTWLAPSGEIFSNLTCPDCWRSLSQTPSEIYFK